MASATLLGQIFRIRRSMLRQKILDGYFVSLEENMQSYENPDFLDDLITIYFKDSENVIASIEQTLERAPVDFNNLDKNLYRLKIGSVSIGATKVTVQISRLKEYLDSCDVGRFKDTVIRLKQEHSYLKGQHEHYLKLQKKARIADMAAR